MSLLPLVVWSYIEGNVMGRHIGVKILLYGSVSKSIISVQHAQRARLEQPKTELDDIDERFNHNMFAHL